MKVLRKIVKKNIKKKYVKNMEFPTQNLMKILCNMTQREEENNLT